MRIGSPSSTATSAQQAPARANSAAGTFQAALASSSEASKTTDAKARTASKPANRTAARQQNDGSATASNPDTATTVPSSRADQLAAPAVDTAKGQGDGTSSNDQSAVTFSAIVDGQMLPPAQVGPQQPADPTSATDAAALDASAHKPGDPVPATDAALLTTVQQALPISAAAATNQAEAAAAIPIQTPAEASAPQIDPALSGTVTSSVSATQLRAKNAQSKISDTAGAKSSESGNPTDAGKNKIDTAVSAQSDGSSHNAQSNNQSSQHPQFDPTQLTANMSRATETATSPAQMAIAHMASHAPATQTSASPSTQEAIRQSLPPTSSGSDEGEVATSSSGINTAQVLQTLSQSEMRVGMHSAEFGNISIRTSVSQQQMLTQISLDHSGLSQAISGHISSIQSKLANDYGLHAQIEVNHQSAAFSGQSQSSSQKEQRAFTPSARTDNASPLAEADIGWTPTTLPPSDSGYRLDIRA